MEILFQKNKSTTHPLKTGGFPILSIMNVEFFNIQKAKVPFLINLKNHNFSDLSKDSKRHYNKSNNKCNVFFEFSDHIHEDIDYNIFTLHFKFDYKTLISLNNSKNMFYMRVKNELNEVIAYNLYYQTSHPEFEYVYSSCPYMKYKNYDLNNLIWFRSIEFFKSINIDYLDLEFEYDLKLKNKIKYYLNDLVSFQYIINNRDKNKSFCKENSSKFLFLTESEKLQKNSFFIMTVCNCGQKNLINVSVENLCFKCNSILNKIYD